MRKCLVILLFLCAACGGADMQAEAQKRETLASLALIDPYPAYAMKYVGDYALDTVLANGVKNDTDLFRLLSSVQPFSNLTSARKFTFDGKACTGFTAMSETGEYYFGHNEDWDKSQYLVLSTSPDKGYASVSIGDISEMGGDVEGNEDLLFTPFYPLAGMNSEGLAVSSYSVPHCAPSEEKDKPYLIWPVAIRLLLDRAANVDEALQLLNSYNILFEEGNCLQFLVGDAQGGSMVVEWNDGRTVAIRKSGDWQVVTNFTQEGALESDFKGCWRYQTASDFLELHKNKMSHELGMELLGKTSQAWESGGTQFSVLFNLSRRELRITFGGDDEKIHSFDIE